MNADSSTQYLELKLVHELVEICSVGTMVNFGTLKWYGRYYIMLCTSHDEAPIPVTVDWSWGPAVPTSATLGAALMAR